MLRRLASWCLCIALPGTCPLRVLVVGTHTLAGAACAIRAREHLWSVQELAPGMPNVTDVICESRQDGTGDAFVGVLVDAKAVNEKGERQLRDKFKNVYSVRTYDDAIRTTDALLGTTI